MRREELVDLNAFVTVAEAHSFTRAAAKLGASTEAGERLLKSLAPALENIAEALGSVVDLRDKPAGNIRITTSEHAAHAVLWPALEKLLPLYPDLHGEMNIEGGFTDIVEQRYDAGVRLGESIAKDRVAVRIGPDLRMAVVGSPGYFATRPKPKTPQDLAEHACINLRLPTMGGLYAWELEKGRRELKVRVEGQLAFNNVAMIVRAALAGFGLACVLDDQIAPQVADGRLIRVLDDWRPPFSGYHLYYPSRRQPSAAFAAPVDALRYRGGH